MSLGVAMINKNAKKYTFELSIDVTIDDKYMIEELDGYEGDFTDIDSETISWFSGKLKSWLNNCVKQKDVEMNSYSLYGCDE